MTRSLTLIFINLSHQGGNLSQSPYYYLGGSKFDGEGRKHIGARQFVWR